jgi:hypothetical protein
MSVLLGELAHTVEQWRRPANSKNHEVLFLGKISFYKDTRIKMMGMPQPLDPGACVFV